MTELCTSNLTQVFDDREVNVFLKGITDNVVCVNLQINYLVREEITVKVTST